MDYKNINYKKKSLPLLNPLCVALDVDDKKSCLKLVDEIGDVAGGYKVGPRLILREGSSLITTIAKTAPVFLDFKFFDIPSTMVSAVKAGFDAGASLVTVHAQAGIEALSQLAILEQEYQKTKPVKILAVTILTSFDEKTLPSILKTQSIQTHVHELVNLVQQSGLTGVVCSPHELSSLHEIEQFNSMYFVTPGIRGATSNQLNSMNANQLQDQKRVMSAKEAIELGASGLVVGRPIIESKNPREEALKYSISIFE